MDFICGLFGPKYCISIFPRSKNQTVFQSWFSNSNMNQSIHRKYQITPAKKIQLNYGPPNRQYSSYSSDSNTTLDSPKKISFHHTYSKEYREQCAPLLEQMVKNAQVQILLKDLANVIKFHSTQQEEGVIRMIKKSQLFINKKNWVDKDFIKQNKFKQYQLFWERINYLPTINGNQQLVFIASPVELVNVQQGLVGDCYFLSAIAALTNPQLPQRILKIFPSININEQGFYKVRLMFKGILQEVVVDDYFPFYKDKDKGLTLLGCKPCKNHQQIYTLILQKCWAKLCGSYEAIDGGFSHIALHALSGALTKNYNLSEKTIDLKENARFFDKLATFCTNKYVMCAGTDIQTNSNRVYIYQDEFEQKKIYKNIDIPKEHIYCIVNIDKEAKMVKIYNPWGYNEESITKNKIEGGVFYISWDQFITRYHHVTVCKIHDNAHYLYTQLNFKPKQMKFIEFNISKAKTGYFAISLSQTFNKAYEYQYLNVNFIVLKQNQDGSYELVTIRSKYGYSDHYLELHSLAKGKYLIAIYISDDVIKEKLTFGVYSEDQFGFSQLNNLSKDFKDNFLTKVLLKYDNVSMIGKPQQKIYPINKIGGNVWISASLVGESRIGYIILNVGKNQQQEYSLTMSYESLKYFGLSLLHPYDTKPSAKLTAKPGFVSVAVVMITDIKKYVGKQFIDKRAFFRQLSKGPSDSWKNTQQQ